MQYAKRFLMVTGSVALLVMVGSLAAPKAAHALVAALVQVTNTPANPVPVSEVGTQQPFEASCNSTYTFQAAGNTCGIAIPSGKRLVVQSVSAQIQVDNGIHVVNYDIFALNQGQNMYYYPALPAAAAVINPTASPYVFFQAAQNVVFYADPGTTLICYVNYDGSPQRDILNFVVTGYLVDAQ